jgi:hypothetical protein
MPARADSYHSLSRLYCVLYAFLLPSTRVVYLFNVQIAGLLEWLCS